jgi:hypothetical protein
MINWISNYKHHWIIFVAIAFVGSILNALKDENFAFAISVALGLVFIMAISAIVGAIILFLIAIFRRHLSFEIFMKGCIVASFLITLSQLINSIFR